VGKHQSDAEFMRTRSAVAVGGQKCLGAEHLEMIDRLTRKDGSGREFGPSQHRRLAMEVAAGSAVVRCALLAQHLLPEVDWIGLFTATKDDAPAAAQEDTEHGPPATDPGNRDAG
jgi:hypothetical protein